MQAETRVLVLLVELAFVGPRSHAIAHVKVSSLIMKYSNGETRSSVGIVC